MVEAASAIAAPLECAKKCKREAEENTINQVSAKKQRMVEQIEPVTKKREVEKTFLKKKIEDINMSDSYLDELKQLTVTIEQPVFVPSKEPSNSAPQRLYGSEDDSSYNYSEKKEDEPTPKSKSSDVEMVAASQQQTHKTPATQKILATGSKTLFVGNLSLSVERPDVVKFFEGAGEIVHIRFSIDDEGIFRGFGYVEFATAEAAMKALELNGQSLLNCAVRLNLAYERGYTTQSSFDYSEVNCNDKDNEEGDDEPGPKKKSSDVEMVAASPQQTYKAPATLKVLATGSKSLFVGNLSLSVERSDIVKFFQGAGEIVHIRFSIDDEGIFKGLGYIEFATTEAAMKAFELNGEFLLNHAVKLAVAHEQPDRERNGDANKPSQICAQSECVYVRGFDTFLMVDKIKSSLEDLFGSCGEISNISLGTDHKSGASLGIACIDFKDIAACSKALELDGTQLYGNTLNVQQGKIQATGEAANMALKLNGEFLSNHAVNLDLARGHSDTTQNSHAKKSFQNCAQSETIHATGLDTSLEVDKIKDTTACSKALELNGTELNDNTLNGQQTKIEATRSKTLELNATQPHDDTLKEQQAKIQATGSKKLFVANLPFHVQRRDVEEFFKNAGEVVDVRLASCSDGSLRGFGHVEFGTTEAASKALELNGKCLFDRAVRLEMAQERHDIAQNGRANRSSQSSAKKSFQSSAKKSFQSCSQSETVYVKGFDTSLEMDKIKSSLEELFGSCGKITNVSIPTNPNTGASLGVACLDFNNKAARSKALELNGTQLGSNTLEVKQK